MLTITGRRCHWCLNDEYGHYWLDIYRYVILVRANKPEIQLGGSVWCFIDVGHVIFVCLTVASTLEGPGLEVVLWCWTTSSGDGGVLVTLHMFWDIYIYIYIVTGRGSAANRPLWTEPQVESARPIVSFRIILQNYPLELSFRITL